MHNYNIFVIIIISWSWRIFLCSAVKTSIIDLSIKINVPQTDQNVLNLFKYLYISSKRWTETFLMFSMVTHMNKNREKNREICHRTETWLQARVQIQPSLFYCYFTVEQRKNPRCSPKTTAGLSTGFMFFMGPESLAETLIKGWNKTEIKNAWNDKLN